MKFRVKRWEKKIIANRLVYYYLELVPKRNFAFAVVGQLPQLDGTLAWKWAWSLPGPNDKAEENGFGVAASAREAMEDIENIMKRLGVAFLTDAEINMLDC